MAKAKAKTDKHSSHRIGRISQHLFPVMVAPATEPDQDDAPAAPPAPPAAPSGS